MATGKSASRALPDQPIFNVALADDHPIVMDGIAAVLQRLSYVRVVVRATDGRQLLDALPKAGPIHLAFVDLSMPVMDGFETIAALRELWPDLPAIAFSFNNSDQWILKAMHLGARGYIVKTEGNGNPFVQAVEQMRTNGCYITERVHRCMLENPDGISKEERERKEALALLSSRHLEVIKEVISDREPNSTQAAANLNLKPRTVDSHIYNICKLLGLKSRMGLGLWAVRAGLVK